MKLSFEQEGKYEIIDIQESLETLDRKNDILTSELVKSVRVPGTADKAKPISTLERKDTFKINEQEKAVKLSTSLLMYQISDDKEE